MVKCTNSQDIYANYHEKNKETREKKGKCPIYFENIGHPNKVVKVFYVICINLEANQITIDCITLWSAVR